MKEIINEIQHALNPLHIFVRLIEEGYDPKVALELAALYEEIFFNKIVSNILEELHKTSHQQYLQDKK